MAKPIGSPRTLEVSTLFYLNGLWGITICVGSSTIFKGMWVGVPVPHPFLFQSWNDGRNRRLSSDSLPPNTRHQLARNWCLIVTYYHPPRWPPYVKSPCGRIHFEHPVVYTLLILDCYCKEPSGQGSSRVHRPHRPGKRCLSAARWC